MKGQKISWIIFLLVLVILVALPFLVKKDKIEDKTMPTTGPIRQSAVAGSFYPADQSELDQQLNNFLLKAEKISVPGKLRILIVPHAGIVYSGATAASGFKQIEGQNYSRIIILGASHQAWFDHVAVADQGVWETPLGQVEIDQDLAQALINYSSKITADPQPHQEEHSLELELVFLQKVLKNFKIVPILLSQTNDQLINDLVQAISQNFDEQTLLVISTDLSHYPSKEVADKVDSQTIEAILTGKEELFSQKIKELENAHYPSLDTCACGSEAIRVALKLGEILGIAWQKINYQNSGDISGDQSRVVGYGTIGGWSESLAPAESPLDEKAQKEALEIARQTLEAHLTGKPNPSISPQSQSLNQPLGAFVTLRKDEQLRGCIGAFEPTKPLYQVIQAMAIAAATKDFRFPPVKAEELKDLTIEISVMSPKKKISHWQEIQLGKDGVVIQKGSNSGTFLPQVAAETGWSLEEFLSELCSQKAGLAPDCYKDPSVTLYTFQAQVFEEEN